jgi:hypothetical protein
MSDDDILKKILKNKNPSLTDEQANMIVDSEQKSFEKIDKEYLEKGNSIPDTPGLTEEENKKRKDLVKRDLEIEKEKKKQQVIESKVIYKNRTAELKKESKSLKKEIKVAVFNFIRESKTVSKKMVTSSIEMSSVIAAIGVVIAAPPWNVPLAISYAMSIIEIILNFISQIKNIISFTVPLEKINLIVKEDRLGFVSTVIDVFIKIIKTAWGLLSTLEAFVTKLLNLITTKIFSDENKNKTFKKAEKKLDKLGYCKNSNIVYSVDGISVRANNQEDAEESLSILQTYKVSCKVDNCKITGYKNDIDPNILTMMNVNTPSEKDIKSDAYLYDVELPNGRVLFNKSESDIDQLKLNYEVIIKQVIDLNDRISNE